MRSKLLLIALIALLLVGCNPNKIPKFKSMKISDTELSSDETTDIRFYLKNAENIMYKFIEEPDYMIVCKKANGYDEFYSIYLKDQLVYPGDGFYAIFDNLSRKKSKCYKIDEDNLYMFKELAAYAR